MFRWQKGLASIDSDVIENMCQFWTETVPGSVLTDTGKKSIRKLIKQFSIAEVLEAIRVSSDQYVEMGSDGRPTSESSAAAFQKLGGICRLTRLDDEDPQLKKLYYIRGIARNRFTYFDDRKGLDILKDAIAGGSTFEQLEAVTRKVGSWSAWRSAIEELSTSQEPEEPQQNSSEEENSATRDRNIDTIMSVWRTIAECQGQSARNLHFGHFESLVGDYSCEEVVRSMCSISREKIEGKTADEIYQRLRFHCYAEAVTSWFVRRFPSCNFDDVSWQLKSISPVISSSEKLRKWLEQANTLEQAVQILGKLSAYADEKFCFESFGADHYKAETGQERPVEPIPE